MGCLRKGWRRQSGGCVKPGNHAVVHCINVCWYVQTGPEPTRGDVVRGAAARLHRVELELLGDAKVGYLEQAVLAEQQILELQVSVGVARVVEVLDPGHELEKVVESEALARVTLPLDNGVEELCGERQVQRDSKKSKEEEAFISDLLLRLFPGRDKRRTSRGTLCKI